MSRPRRGAFTASQVAVLEAAYVQNSKPSTAERRNLSLQLKLQPRQIQIWFQNARARSKLKQQTSLQFPILSCSPPPPQSLYYPLHVDIPGTVEQASIPLVSDIPASLATKSKSLDIPGFPSHYDPKLQSAMSQYPLPHTDSDPPPLTSPCFATSSIAQEAPYDAVEIEFGTYPPYVKFIRNNNNLSPILHQNVSQIPVPVSSMSDTVQRLSSTNLPKAHKFPQTQPDQQTFILPSCYPCLPSQSSFDNFQFHPDIPHAAEQQQYMRYHSTNISDTHPTFLSMTPTLQRCSVRQILGESLTIPITTSGNTPQSCLPPVSASALDLESFGLCPADSITSIPYSQASISPVNYSEISVISGKLPLSLFYSQPTSKIDPDVRFPLSPT